MNQINKSTLMLLVALAALSAVQAAASPRAVKDKPTCEPCESAVKKAQEMAKDPKVIDKIHQKVDMACDFLKILNQDQQCRDIVNKYLDQAIEQISQLDPLDFCQKIQMCSPEQVAERRAKPQVSQKFLAAIKPEESGDEMCQHCIDIMTKLGDYVKAHDDASVMKLLEDVCLQLDNQTDQAACAAIVGVFSGNIIQLIRDMKSPEEFCKDQISLC